MPPDTTHRPIQLAGRPRYWLPADPEILRATIALLVRSHERARRRTITPTGA